MAIDISLEFSTVTFGQRTNTTITKPTNTTSGDLLLAALYTEIDAVTPPSGWTLINSAELDNSDGWLKTYYKLAGGSEPSDYTWTHSSSWTEGMIKRFTGVDPSTPLDCTPSEDNGIGITATSTAITTATAGAALVQVIGDYNAVDYGGWTLTNERYDGAELGWADDTQESAGSSGSKSVTLSMSDYWTAQLIALRPYTAASLEQEGYRFRNDDGSETGATWAANQDTGMTAATGTNKRLRVLVNATGDPSSAPYQLQYKKSSDTDWKTVH